MLTDEQFEANCRYRRGLEKVLEAVRRLNALAYEFGMDVREIPEYPFGLSMADSQAEIRRHVKEVDEHRAAAMERLAA